MSQQVSEWVKFFSLDAFTTEFDQVILCLSLPLPDNFNNNGFYRHDKSLHYLHLANYT